MAKLLDSQRVNSPDRRHIQVLFYDDDSLRVRIHGSPMVFKVAFVPGKKQHSVLIKIAPKHPHPALSAVEDE